MLGIIRKTRNKSSEIVYGVIDSDDNVVEYVKPDVLLNLAKTHDLDIVGISSDKSYIMNVYELCWRFDFDKTLKSVYKINGEDWDYERNFDEIVICVI